VVVVVVVVVVKRGRKGDAMVQWSSTKKASPGVFIILTRGRCPSPSTLVPSIAVFVSQ